MKTKLSLSLFCLTAVATSIFFSGCQDRIFKTYIANVPIYISFDEWRSMDVNLEPSQDLEFPGKIYIVGDYLLVNELYKGIHVYDNGNPSSPNSIGFLDIPGNVDMAVRNDMLHVDSFYDLLVIDISDIQSPQLVSRVEDAFEFTNAEAVPGLDPNFPIAEWNLDKGLVIGWKVEEVTTEEYPNHFFYEGDFLTINNFDAAVAADPTIPSIGIGGSMAQFTVVGDFLYTLQENALTTYNISDPQQVSMSSDILINMVGETIFPAQGNLFIGTQWGMMIYSIQNPSNPTWVSTYDHVVSCDPVVVDGDYAYVTLATGRRCWMGLNQLEVIDISNLSSPTLLKEFEMTNPQGLGVDNETLFLCDRGSGLKVFDISDPLTLDQHQLAIFPDIDTYDVIPYNDVLIMVGNDGIYQYDYSDPTNVFLLSSITIQ